LAAGAAALPAAPQIAWAQAPSAPATLSPTGKLRVALIASNPVLVTRGTDGSLGGVSVSIARTLAARLGVPVELKPYDNPVRYNESLASDDWDIGLAARDPSRAEYLAFSVTFMEVDNGYVARAEQHRPPQRRLTVQA
jgi:polar amino acid transport system substrate-binding protein